MELGERSLEEEIERRVANKTKFTDNEIFDCMS